MTVATGLGYNEEATSFYYNGVVNDGIEIKTQNGFNFRGTSVHKIICLDENHNAVWKKLSEIRKGDFTLIKLDSCIVDSSISRSISTLLGKKYNVPLYSKKR